MLTPHSRAWLQIHFCVLLWGFTAILGKLITLQALPLVWWRMTLVTSAMLFVPGFWKGLGKLQPRMIAIYSGIGVLVALHWLSFYGAIKLSNASVGATCMALTPFFVAFVEPLFVARRFDAREVFFALAAIPGVALVVGGTPVGMRLGIPVGFLAALIAAIFSALNKRYVHRGAALTITGLEMGAGAVALTLFSLLPLSEGFRMPAGPDILYLLALALGCTLLPYALALVAMRQLSAFATALAVNMEPVYAVLLAIVLLHEQQELTGRFYLGVGVILAVVFSHPLIGPNRGPETL